MFVCRSASLSQTRRDLSVNFLTTLSDEIFFYTSNLTEIQLQNNSISSLPLGIFDWLADGVTMYVGPFPPLSKLVLFSHNITSHLLFSVLTWNALQKSSRMDMPLFFFIFLVLVLFSGMMIDFPHRQLSGNPLECIPTMDTARRNSIRFNNPSLRTTPMCKPSAIPPLPSPPSPPPASTPQSSRFPPIHQDRPNIVIPIWGMCIGSVFSIIALLLNYLLKRQRGRAGFVQVPEEEEEEEEVREVEMVVGREEEEEEEVVREVEMMVGKEGEEEEVEMMVGKEKEKEEEEEGEGVVKEVEMVVMREAEAGPSRIR